MTPYLVEQSITAAKYREKEYAALYRKTSGMEVLEFIESYDDFEEMVRAKRWWKAEGYSLDSTWVLGVQECTCAMTESSMWSCRVHGENAPPL